jgi:serine protease Do
VSERIEFRKKQRLAPSRALSAAALVFVAFAAVLLFSVLRLSSRGSSATEEARAGLPAAEPADESISRSRRNAIVTAAERVGPAVVSIGVVATRIVRGVNPMYDEFFDFFFRDFLPPTRQYKYRESIPNIGSGVIVSPDGYVVTNEHVVHGAEKITVVTPDGLTLSGKLAGVHEASDIALIKVDADNLPYAPLGDSDDLMVGEWAIAIGNPFGNLIEDAHPSVTVGVVSARKRSFKPGSGGKVYDDMIQTDAAINPGNSGGPLVNADGQVIGINTFIFTRSGGSLGVGFAIPINRAKKVLEEVKKYGKVRDVWLGFTVIAVDGETARALRLPAGGAIVRSVETGSPADEAGFRPGDVIARMNARVINDADDALSAFGSVLVGETFSIDVLRKDKELHLTLVAREKS